MGLFSKKKKAEPVKNSANENLERLVNGELPFGWAYHFKNVYKPKDDQVTSLAIKVQSAKTKEEKIATLQTLIDYFYSYKAECKSMGECFEKYFDDMWMHCQNSKCKDFIYITPYEEELEKLKS